LKLENEEQFYSNATKDQKLRYREMLMHEQLWNHLSHKTDTEVIDAEFVYILFRILLDPAQLPIEEISKILEDYIRKYRESQGISFDEINNPQDSENGEIETWTIQILVKKFRKLNENRLAYTKIGYLKPEKFEEIKKQNEEFTFKPKLPTASAMMEQNHTQKFLMENPIELKRPQTTRANNRDNFNKLLFEVKDIERALTGRDRAEDVKVVGENQKENETASFQGKNIRKINRVDILLKKEEVKNKKIGEKKKIIEIEKLKECTFHPQTTGFKAKEPRGDTTQLVQRLYDQHKIKQRKEEELQLEQMEKQAKELEACTFRPEINAKTVSHSQDSSTVGVKAMPKGYEKTIGRLRYALDENKKKKEALEKVPTGENYEKNRNAGMKPFTFLTKEKKSKNPPFVYVDVNVAPGRTGRIGIHEEDDPQTLARNFAVAFQLNQEMFNSLEELITQQINGYLSRKDGNNTERLN